MQNYLATVETEYAQSPTIGAILQAVNAWIDPANSLNLFYNNVWNLNTATGWGLDVLGRIVGVSRNLSVPTYGIYALGDFAFRQLINAKALANISDGSIPSLNNILMTLFPNGGNSYVVDNLNMTMTVHLGFTPTKVQVAILTAAFPLPCGVVTTFPGGSSPALSVSVQTGTAASGPFGSDTFSPNTATASGGSGSYSFAWTETDDAAGTWSIANGSTPTATFSVSGVANGVTSSASLKCTVTDTITGSTANATASYSLDNTTVAGTFTVSINPGLSIISNATSYAFPPNTVSVSGGTGPFTYLWRETDDGLAHWSLSGPGNPSVILTASGFRSGSSANLTCTVTDTSNGNSVTSNPAYYFISGTF